MIQPTKTVTDCTSTREPRRTDLRVGLASACHRLLGVNGLNLVLPDGTTLRAKGTPVATVQLHRWKAVRALLTRDQSALFTCFLDRDLDVAAVGPPSNDEAEGLLAAYQVIDEQSRDVHVLSAALSSSRYWWQQNTERRRANLAVHYSVPPAFWLSFLKNDYPIYSHYLFEAHETWEAWEAACERKLQFAVDVCHLRPGDQVLNIGEGWGGFLTYAGRRGIRVTSITLNDESYGAVRAKLGAESLDGTCNVIKTDFYHFTPGTTFDAITNMGVTEHLTDYDGLIAKYATLLNSGGCVYSDFVGVLDDSHFRALVQKYVYPGAEAVYLPRLLDAVRRHGQFDIVSVHDDRLSYDKTCVAWARNVEAVRDVIIQNFGERQYRWVWSYLWMSVYGFRSARVGLTGTRVVLRKR